MQSRSEIDRTALVGWAGAVAAKHDNARAITIVSRTVAEDCKNHCHSSNVFEHLYNCDLWALAFIIHLRLTATRKPLAWITGSGGLIGSHLVRSAAAPGAACQIVGLSRETLDLTDHAAVRERFRREQPSLIIHCAAMSKSGECERNPLLARKVNVESTAVLAELAAAIPFFFFSTDLVFDGRKGFYAETDSVNPLTVYAETKIAAEQFVLGNPKHTVIRTSLNGGKSPSGDRGFSDELRKCWREGRTARLFVDEYRTPIPAIETARVVWELVGAGATGPFHVAGNERLSRLQIGQLVAAQFPELNPKIESATLADYHGPRRSPDTTLNCAKAEKVLGRSLPALTEWLKSYRL